jgi:hypothetical protein
MQMKIFICWSGDQSKQVGAAMHSWLPKIFGERSDFDSEESIEKGALV